MVTHYPRSNYVADAIRRCPDCNSRDLVEDYSRSELYCNQCGQVIEDNISRGDEKNYSYDTDQKSQDQQSNHKLQRIIAREKKFNSPKESYTIFLIKKQLERLFKRKDNFDEGIYMLKKMRNHTTQNNTRLLVGYSSVLTAAVTSQVICNWVKEEQFSFKQLLEQVQQQLEDPNSPFFEPDTKKFESEIRGCINKIFKGFNQLFPHKGNLKSRTTNHRLDKLEKMIHNLKDGEQLPSDFSLPESLVDSLQDFHRYPSKGQPLDTFHSELIYQYCRRFQIKISRRSIFQIGLGKTSKAKTEHWSKDISEIIDYWEGNKHDND